MAKQGTLFLLAGAGALLLMSGKKKKRKASAEVDVDEPAVEDEREDLDEEDEDLGLDEIEEEVEELDGDEEDAVIVLSRYLDPEGRAQLGMLYQIKPGDTPLEICREALFGSRDPVTEPWMLQAARDLLVRIDCGPWNQVLYGVPLSELKAGHADIDSYFTQKGVSFNPIYQDNYKRIVAGLRPSAESGSHFALIWIPMINLDKFDMEGIVTTEGSYHQDTPRGMGGSAIDPPQEILDFEFENVSAGQVGCDLPEGDFRRMVVANG